MPNLFQQLAFFYQSADLPQLPIGRLEQISIVALETAIIWVLWKAYREKDSQLQDLIQKNIANDTRLTVVMDRVERLLDSLKHSDAH
jgi:uncharacterized protein YigA (DUF484 family)